MTDTRIMLASGALFDILDPEGSDFTLGDAKVPLHALAITATALPRRPLYLSLSLQPQPWKFWG